MEAHEISKKIKDSIDNPIDICIYKLADIVSPFFYKLGFSPNMITFIGLIIGLISAYFIYKNNILLALTFLWISYFLDALDGTVARKYNMQTELGGYFDHIRDVVVFGFVCLLIVYKSHNRLFNLFIILFYIG
jgi:CDP-diacylglycerol--glycerol-3-phosphate 3-phosphatidyltransferase